MKLVNLTCPQCNASLSVDSERQNVFCEYCGAKLFIDDEVNRVKVDNAEQFGYDFEKGRQRALYEQSQPNVRTVYVSNVQPVKKNKTWLWVLGWLFIPFITGIIFIFTRENLTTKQKWLIIGAIVFGIWLLSTIGNFADNVSKIQNAQIKASVSDAFLLQKEKAYFRYALS